MTGHHSLAAALACSLLLCAAVAMAAAPADLSMRMRELVDQGELSPDTEVEVVVGEPDSRLDLAPCDRYEPFVPAGARLWGRTSLGVRCVAGANWTVFVPVQVKVYGPTLVAARPVARGQLLGADDLRLERGEWTRWPAGVVIVAQDQAEGRIATRSIQPGEPVRREMLREAPLFRAGEPIRIVYAGQGFAVNAEGKALSAGFDGQQAQAALGGGRVVTGVVRRGGVLEIR